ncbi:hypothetical protein [Klebsiella sp. BIGb0407]|uniref:hypothetical protein n=1 Tax=Klebsiella sp. BIGb0407 TaxID=2940603 RepID=UPI0021673B60|nr:hypothetical protein [Klebsiella sp. BIGb0407]MCS3433765.1 hypothetical protein [Klebsiella sp. BIGb0407]
MKLSGLHGKKPHYLEVGNNPLTGLPKLPSELQYLVMTNTLLTSMPVLPPNLHRLNVRISHSADAKEYDMRPLLQKRARRTQIFR